MSDLNKNGMRGVLNSGLNPAEVSPNILLNALGQPDYLIALLQKHLYDRFAYNQDDFKWGDISPNKYRQIMNEVILCFEQDIRNALRKADSKIKDSFQILDDEDD